jgi:8-oxo-dGTP pyrophosphatase MutT (NUDIX family)
MQYNPPQKFINANHEMVDYDGSPVEWRVSVYGLVIENDSLLVLKNKNEKFWDVPGGGLEMGEDLADALLREGKEEVGWSLQLIKPLWEAMDWFYHDGEKKYYRSLQLFWLAKGEKLDAAPTDPRTTDVKFVALEELVDLPLYPKVVTALEKNGLLKV